MALTDNIVGCYSPSFGPTASTLLDRSAQNNHGALVNMDQSTDWVQTQIGRALDLDGTDDYVRLNQRNFYSLIGGVSTASVSMWIYPRSTSRNTYLADYTAAGGNETIRVEMSGFGMTSGRIGASVLTQSNSVQTSSAPALSTWHHFLFCSAGGRLALFWNGVLNATASYAVLSATNNAMIALGRAGEVNSLYSNALFGETVFWSRSLTGPEAAETFRRGNGGVGRILSGQTRRRTYGFIPPTFRAAWIQRAKLIGGGV